MTELSEFKFKQHFWMLFDMVLFSQPLKKLKAFLFFSILQHSNRNLGQICLLSANNIRLKFVIDLYEQRNKKTISVQF